MGPRPAEIDQPTSEEIAPSTVNQSSRQQIPSVTVPPYVPAAPEMPEQTAEILVAPSQRAPVHAPAAGRTNRSSHKWRKKEEGGRQLNIWIPDSVFLQVRMTLVAQDRTMTEVVETLLRRFAKEPEIAPRPRTES
jgi:hypothetical protein